MTKILLLGPSFYGYTQSVERALKKKGFDVKKLEWESEDYIYSLTDKIKAKLWAKRGVLVQQNKEKFNEKAYKLFTEFNPDCVLVIRGAILSRKTLLSMSKVPILLWMMDSLLLTQSTLKNIDLYNKVFVFERDDISLLKYQYGIDAYFLPLALDEQVYFPIERRNKTIDVLFVGALYPNRVETLNNLIKKFPDKKIKIYGFYFSKIRDLKRYFLRKDKRYYLNKTVSPKKLNHLYSKSKLCLNIHHSQSQYGVNQRFFEISGTKSLQVCDQHGFISDNFDSNEILIFETEQELYQIIETVLYKGADMESKKQKAYDKVLANHTFINRVEFIIEKAAFKVES